MKLDELLEGRRDRVIEIARAHGVKKISAFGSFARGDARPDSDLDLLLIEYGPERTPWFAGGLIYDLEELLGRRVDVTTPDSLPLRIRERVLADAVVVQG